MAYTTAQRDALREAIATGATRVRYRDREVTYRDLDEMREILRLMDRDLDVLVDRPRRSRQTRFVTTKGLC